MARIAQIVSTARYLPEHIVTNAELTARFAALGRPDVINKLGARTGINQRFYVPKDWVTSDLALAAAKEALKRAGRKPEDVDLVILGTTSPDCIAPNTAVVLQHKLGAKNAGTFDVDCACAAFPAQVAIAAGLIATNAAMKTILLVGGYDLQAQRPNRSRHLFLGRWSRRRGRGRRRPGGLYRRCSSRRCTYAFGWGIAAGGTFEPASIDAVKGGRTQMRREAGNYPASVNEDNWPRLFKRLSAECGFTADQVDQLIFTQISKPSIAIAAERCNVPIEKCHTIMQKWGYTGSACIPMALDDAIELGKIKRGDLVVMISSGLGWNQAAAAIRWTM